MCSEDWRLSRTSDLLLALTSKDQSKDSDPGCCPQELELEIPILELQKEQYGGVIMFWEALENLSEVFVINLR